MRALYITILRGVTSDVIHNLTDWEPIKHDLYYCKKDNCYITLVSSVRDMSGKFADRIYIDMTFSSLPFKEHQRFIKKFSGLGLVPIMVGGY